MSYSKFDPGCGGCGGCELFFLGFLPDDEPGDVQARIDKYSIDPSVLSIGSGPDRIILAPGATWQCNVTLPIRLYRIAINYSHWAASPLEVQLLDSNGAEQLFASYSNDPGEFLAESKWRLRSDWTDPAYAPGIGTTEVSQISDGLPWIHLHVYDDSAEFFTIFLNTQLQLPVGLATAETLHRPRQTPQPARLTIHNPTEEPVGFTSLAGVRLNLDPGPCELRPQSFTPLLHNEPIAISVASDGTPMIATPRITGKMPTALSDAPEPPPATQTIDLPGATAVPSPLTGMDVELVPLAIAGGKLTLAITITLMAREIPSGYVQDINGVRYQRDDWGPIVAIANFETGTITLRNTEFDIDEGQIQFVGRAIQLNYTIRLDAWDRGQMPGIALPAGVELGTIGGIEFLAVPDWSNVLRQVGVTATLEPGPIADYCHIALHREPWTAGFTIHPAFPFTTP